MNDRVPAPDAPSPRYAVNCMQAQHLFVGPVSFKRGPNRTLIPYFYVLQGGSGTLMLEYPDKLSAKASREQLLQSTNTHNVPSIKLLKAISEAFEALKPPPPPETGGRDIKWDSSTSGDDPGDA